LGASMSLAPYRPREGVYARGVAGTGLVLLSLFASVRFYHWLSPRLSTAARFDLLGLHDIPYSACGAGLLFLVLAALSCLFAVAFRTGVKAIDSKTSAFVDLLIETEGELQKVSWPGKEELVNYTTVVIACMVFMGLLLFCIDQVVAFVMSSLRVLPL